MRYSQLLRSMVLGFVFMVLATGDFALAEVRTWSDATGKFKIEAELIEATDEHVVLQKTDGKTVKVPIAKLSEADQQFVADQQAASLGEEMPAESAETPAETTEESSDATEEASAPADAATDIKAARKAATDFLDMLRKDDRQPIGALLTKAAKAKVADGTSPVLSLAKPDSKSTTKIGKATIDGNDATVAIKLRLSGVNQDGKISLRREGKAWKVWSLSLTPTGNAGGTEAVANFETGESSVPAATAVAGGAAPSGPQPVSLGGGRSVGLVRSEPDPEPDATEEPGAEPEMKEGGETEAPSGDETASVDKNDPKALLKQIETLRSDPRINQDRAFRTQSFTSIADAAETILDLENATKPQRTAAAKHQFEALQALSQLGVPNLSKRAESLAAHVDEYGLKDLARPVEALNLQLKVASATSPKAFTAAIAKVEEFMASGAIGPQEAMLANAAAQVAEQMQRRGMPADEVAAAIETLAGPLASSRVAQISQLGEQLLGKARRLGLVGKPMELHGVTWDGKPLDMSQFEGKVVLVDFWATWCGPCIAEMPNIRANYEKYHDQGFEVIAISIDSKLDALNQYVQKEQPPWTVVADRHAKTPASKQLAAYYGVNAIPCTILIGRDGNVVSLSARGPQLEQQLKKLLGSGG